MQILKLNIINDVKNIKLMETEELRLLRENNYMLKQILNYLQSQGNNYGKDFIINVLANLTADGMQYGKQW